MGWTWRSVSRMMGWMWCSWWMTCGCSCTTRFSTIGGSSTINVAGASRTIPPTGAGAATARLLVVVEITPEVAISGGSLITTSRYETGCSVVMRVRTTGWTCRSVSWITGCTWCSWWTTSGCCTTTSLSTTGGS
jgi:hypothetical protein